MTSEKGSRKDKNQNIQVFVRLRPLNQRERDIKSLGVIEVVHNREIIVRQSQQSNHTKKFTFDRAFGPQAKQVEVYQDVVSPLIEEVLAGYNCTVFAYGQTGTGKTHTMVGESTGDEHTWQNDPLAGIIPRALSQLFDELRLSNTEYTVRVSYLELYNEELFDLLSASEDNSKLRIYEDVTRKGSNIVNGLEEITVSNKNEVYKIMAQGQERKRVASTLMNAQSSRSHTVFTIVVHMRENSPEGEELVKIGKLNLVDLAGSENISKAGSDNPAKRERARECVNINQSLLTLGRVITALVERHPHIPYRESKLTRILQESLGGRTKTSIIATISPGHKDLEETMSTLEYANRAKNIQNKPEVNQKMTKKAILKEYAEEIDRLKRDLQASRDKNGVYLATDTYTEITLKQEEQRKEIQELLLQKRAVEEQKDKVEVMFSEMNRTLEKRDSELNKTRGLLHSVQTELANTANKLQSSQQECSEQKYLVSAVSAAERALAEQARELLAAAGAASDHASRLHDTVDKRRSVESRNLQTTLTFRQLAAQQRRRLADTAAQHAQDLAQGLAHLHTELEHYTTNNTTTLEANKVKLEDIMTQILDTMNEIKAITDASHSQLVPRAQAQSEAAQRAAQAGVSALGAAAQRLLQRAAAALRAAQGRDLPRHVAGFVQHWHAGAAERVGSLRLAQRTFSSGRRGAVAARAGARLPRAADLRARKDRKDELLQALNEKVEKDNMELEKRLMEQLEEIEAERSDSQRRLQAWLEEERRLFELRLERHVEQETEAMEQRLSKKSQAIEEERIQLQARLSSHLALQERLLEANAQDAQAAAEEMQRWQAADEEDERALTDYDKEVDEGTSAISTDMEVFSTNVVEVVDHICGELIGAMELANQETEREAESVVCEARAAGEQFASGATAAMDEMVSAHRSLLDDIIHNIQEKNVATSSTLSEISTSLVALAAACDSARGAHGASVLAVRRQLGLLEDNLRGAVAALEEVEDKCLKEEYKVYSPTGKTPARTTYSYPRALTACSPAERLLQRYRAALHDDTDCIVVESESESRTSDCESSTEDFTVFAAPSPPAPLALQACAPRNNTQPDLHNGHSQGIVKCTSETDIYSIKKNQDNGKENANRSINYKKSKLPAPSSVKKPFVERNGIDN